MVYKDLPLDGTLGQSTDQKCLVDLCRDSALWGVGRSGLDRRVELLQVSILVLVVVGTLHRTLHCWAVATVAPSDSPAYTWLYTT
jgi:hypothetical protein